MSTRRLWIFAHIPKTGGSTMKGVLRRNFGSGFREDKALLYHKAPYSLRELEMLIRGHPRVTCFAGHRFGARVPCIPKLKSIVFAQVRDPGERFLSHYFFHRDHIENFFPQTKAMSLDDYFKWAVVESNAPELIDYQTWFLTGARGAAEFRTLQSLMQSRQLFVFPLDRFDEVLIWLKATNPEIFRDLRYTVLNKNSATRGNFLTQKHWEFADRLNNYAELDCALLKLANEQLDALLSEAFPGADQLEHSLREHASDNENWSRRCRRRAVIAGFWRSVCANRFKP